MTIDYEALLKISPQFYDDIYQQLSSHRIFPLPETNTDWRSAVGSVSIPVDPSAGEPISNQDGTIIMQFKMQFKTEYTFNIPARFLTIDADSTPTQSSSQEDNHG